MKRLTTLTFVPFVGLMFFTGCSPQSDSAPQGDSQAGIAAPDHDPHDIPLTEQEKEALRQGATDYVEAVTQVKSYRDTIREGVSAGNPAVAHRPLDELDVVLEYLPTAARESEVPRTEWETVNTSAQQLRESFNKVHAQVDAGEEPDYQAVSGEIDAAIARLDGVSTGRQQ